jgi:glycosyltransferase involved in cell wall biosynthesis
MKYKVSIVIPTKNRLEKVSNCLESIYTSTLKEIEIIVIDDNSDPDVKKEFKKRHAKKVKLIENKESKRVGINRTIGAKMAKAKYVLFIDDDNIIASNMIEKLYEVMEKYKDICIVMPAMYFKGSKKTLFYSGVQTSLVTSYLKVFPLEESKKHLYQDIGINTAPNVFMVRKDQGNKVGWFDPFLIGVYTDLDYFLKVKRLKPRSYIAINPDTKCWHDTPLLIRGYRDETYKNKNRMYLLGRNRGIIMKRYAKVQYLVFFSIFLYPLFSLFYSYNIVRSGSLDGLKSFLKGTFDGYKYILK